MTSEGCECAPICVFRLFVHEVMNTKGYEIHINVWSVFPQNFNVSDMS